jgi:hypothetical protein
VRGGGERLMGSSRWQAQTQCSLPVAAVIGEGASEVRLQHHVVNVVQHHHIRVTPQHLSESTEREREGGEHMWRR